MRRGEAFLVPREHSHTQTAGQTRGRLTRPALLRTVVPP